MSTQSKGIALYSGTVTYWRGKWQKDSNDKDFVGKDDNNLEFFTDETFDKIPSKSVEQLAFILSKRIQETKNLQYPVYIDWRDVKATIVGHIPETSERFEALADRF